MRTLAAVLLAPLLSAQQPQAEKFADALDLVVDSIRELHPDPYWRNEGSMWRRETASLRFRLDALSEPEFLAELQRLVALLHDGHSGVMRGFWGRVSLPLELSWFAEGLFITAAKGAHKDIVGWRILSVDGVDLDEVTRRLLPMICADNEASARRQLVPLCLSPKVLFAIGVARTPDAVTLTVVDLDGKNRKEMRVAVSERHTQMSHSITPGQPLLRDKHPERPWFSESPDPETTYLRFREVAEPQPGDFAKFCKSVFATIEQDSGCRRLVIDLRGNGGGSNCLLQPLIHGAIRSRLNKPGALFIITDEGTFSAAMNLATRLERETWALFVGSPTGARPNHFGDAKTIMMPSLGFMLRCSTVRWWDSDPRDNRRWIQPDLPAPLTFTDYRAGRDAALAAIDAWQHRPTEGFDGSQPVSHWFRESQKPAWPPKPSAKTQEAKVAPAEPPKGRETYLGRTIAQTMHWRGAEWLMRKTREDEEHTRRLLEALNLKPGLTVCDLGCGNGYHSLPIAERVGVDGMVFGVDIQQPMLAMLKRRQEKRGLDNIQLIHNTVASPHLPERSCDLILMVDVYHEFSHPVLMLSGLRRALKPGGRLVLVEFRAEDPEVPIRKLHKMSKTQVTKELVANGFRLHGQFDELPWQHVMAFVTARE